MIKLFLLSIFAVLTLSGCHYHNHHYGYYNPHNTNDVILIKQTSDNVTHCNHHRAYSNSCHLH